MNATDVARLCEQAADGDVETDELTLRLHEDGYRLLVDGTTYEGVSEDELPHVLSEHEASFREWVFWYHTAPQVPARWSFLRWLETADGIPPSDRCEALTDGVERTWGQLHIVVHIDEDGARRYDVRHVDDANASPDALDRHTDPLDARWLAKYDDDGRYRPLSTVPTLQTGWRFSNLDATDVVRTVDFFYPATTANWYREQQGALDVTHWAEASGRQTGIYAVTAELEGNAVNWLAEACCVDSQCLKRREWDETEVRELSVPRGDGPFPCREPCSLVIAAARTFALLEREEERSYTLHLTPSEKEQLETLLDAVADGSVGTIREADVGNGANRYRARYLRAKRMDDEGRLGKDPSEQDQ